MNIDIYDNKNNKQNESIFEYAGYYQDYLDSIGINLDEHYTLEDKISLDIDHSRFVNYFRNMAEEHQVKNYIPRPFYPDSDMRQAVCMMHLGYCKENATERNIGLNSIDNQTLKNMVGTGNFKKLGLDPETCLVRMLEYNPGNGIPLHTDSFNAFKSKYGEDGRRITRYFVAVSPWDWGHMLQVHDNIIANWKVGDAYEIPEGIYHLSNNFGIAPKYTLTVTGFVDE